MNLTRSYAILIASLLCLFSIGCGAIGKLGTTLRDLTEIRSEILKKFNETDVNINVRSSERHSAILISFINSDLNNKSPAERAKRAQETAELVKARYPNIQSIDEIDVIFMRVTTSYFVFHFSEGLDGYGFDNQARFLPRFERKQEANNSGVTVNYSPARKQTEIGAHSVQLDGVAGKGLTLLPHFEVPDDTSRVTPKAPATVSFDFASYSPKQRFPGLTKVDFLADHKLVYATEGQFSTSRSADDLVTEFLYLQIPYSAFRKTIAGTSVALRLGQQEFELTPEQLESLRKMSQFVEN